MNKREPYKIIWDTLSPNKPIVLLAGPRQSGKTTFAKDIAAKNFTNSIYFNWDISADKQKIINNPHFFTQEPLQSQKGKPLVILDEIHKYRDWKNYLKGIYDQFANDYQFLITGSGRLEFSRKAGDSLAGRFLKFHIFPFTLAELSNKNLLLKEFIENPLAAPNKYDPRSQETLSLLLEVGGFPEPFLKGSKDFWQMWSSSYGQQIVRDDLRSVADLRNLDLIETLHALIPSRVGSPLSINNLAGDLHVAFETVKNWLMLFDAFYLTFRLSPWTTKISRSILKEKKVYIFNYPTIDDESARFENLVALELYRAVENWNDLGQGPFTLNYLRDKDSKEVDFVLAKNNRPFLLVETKLFDDSPAKNLQKFQDTLNISAVQLVKKEKIKKYFKREKNDLLVVTASQWLSNLP